MGLRHEKTFLNVRQVLEVEKADVAVPTEIPDLNAALRMTSQRARLLTGATGVAIALAHKQSMICRASLGPHAPSLGSRLDVSSGFSGECIRTGSPLRCDDAENDARVDVISCRRLGIRSILAVPIHLEGQIVGLLETFSPQPYAFDDWHVTVAKELAEEVFATRPAVKERTAEPPKLLIQPEPAHKIFLRHVRDLFTRSAEPIAQTYPAAEFWPDVFVGSGVPWKRFAQSLGLHAVMLLLLGTFVKLAVSRPHLVYPGFNRSDVLTYSPSEYPQYATRKTSLARPRKPRTATAERAVITVPREQRIRTQAVAEAPDIKVKRDIRLLQLVSWSQVLPTMPASAVTRTRLTAPTAGVAVVAPPPDVSMPATSRAIPSAGTRVIAPPPAVQGSFAGARGMSTGARGMSIGDMEVVGPAPQIRGNALNSQVWATQSTLRNEAALVVPPPPSIDGIGSTRAGKGDGGTGDTAAGIAERIIPPPPQVSGTGTSSRWSTATSAVRVVPPPPSVDGIHATGGQRGSLSVDGAAQVVPAPPQVSGTGASNRWTQTAGGAESVVPPPPSLSGAGDAGTPLQTARATSAPSLAVNPEVTNGGDPRGEPAGVNVPQTAVRVGEKPLEDKDTPGGRRELSVEPVAPFGTLAASSYFASSEIFIAMERLGSHLTRYIKLVYDYLPYQKRLSEYGPNYPHVDKLRVTRDVSCDESAGSGFPAGNDSQGLAQPQTKLPCFRTTADDYRRALEHHRR